MQWICFAGGADILGHLPEIFTDTDSRPAAAQANDRYAHGGGWFPQDGWTIDTRTALAQYPGDAPLMALAVAQLRDELIILYPHDYVAIVQDDGTYQMARMD